MTSMEEYRAGLESVLPGLDSDRLAIALELAALPGNIRGYGHVKAASVAAARAVQRDLLARAAGTPR